MELLHDDDDDNDDDHDVLISITTTMTMTNDDDDDTEVHPVFGEKAACATVAHTCTPCRIISTKCSATRLSGSCISTSEISVRGFSPPCPKLMKITMAESNPVNAVNKMP